MTAQDLPIVPYQSDDGGYDLLDIGSDVRALAGLIAARSLSPPLAIGLFGAGGSGKSFFLRMLADRTEEVAARFVGQDSPYCRGIVRVSYNAWHHAGSDPRISIAEALFTGLDGWSLTANSSTEAAFRSIVRQQDSASTSNPTSRALWR